MRQLRHKLKEDTYMITREFLKEHFRKHDSITLYKEDGTPVTFSKQYHLVLCGGHRHFVFKNYDELLAFYKKKQLSLTPVITID